ncbi:MAG TPA: RHS repeat-associated core domain-containing protein [Pyrinomonadaceae bacterium]|jgi:RHS repeat-associated protein|nr:RHS repeat-associated core domain-containing protein [Pyrinomonadaceae bacterium]
MVQAKDASGTVLGLYTYDGDGKRIKKETDTEITVFIYDASGKTVAEYSSQLSQEPQVAYITSDNLGTPRINTNAGGAVIARHDYHPFGEEISTSQRTPAVGYDTDEIRKKFTEYERDSETDLDFANARYFRSGAGRFSSPDPLLFSAKVEDPQTWNRYTYSLNNPYRFVDPTGMWVWSNDLGGDRGDDELEAYYTAAANKIKNEKKRNKELKKVKNKVADIIEKRQRIRAAICDARSSLSGLSGHQKAEVQRAIDAYGEEGTTKKNVVLGQFSSSSDARTLFGENGKIFVMLGNLSGENLAAEFTHEGSHVADFQSFIDGEPGSDLLLSETERRAWAVGAYTAKGMGMNRYPSTLPGNLQVWNKGWTDSQIAVAVSNRIDAPDYSTTGNKRFTQARAENIAAIRKNYPSWY